LKNFDLAEKSFLKFSCKFYEKMYNESGKNCFPETVFYPTALISFAYRKVQTLSGRLIQKADI